MRDQAGDAGEKLRLRPAFQPEFFRRLHRVQALDPAEQHDVLPQNVNFHARMPRHLRADFVLGPARLPELQPLARHVNRQRTLRADANGRRADLAPAQFHEQRKFLERAVEFRLNELVDREGVERDHFAHARPFDDQIQHPVAVHRARRHFIDRARALQPLAIGLKPFARIPVLRQQAFPKRQPEAREIQVAAVRRLQVNVIHAQQRNGAARCRQVRRQNRRRRICGGAGRIRSGNFARRVERQKFGIGSHAVNLGIPPAVASGVSPPSPNCEWQQRCFPPVLAIN